MNAYLKDLFREIKNTIGRFLSLLIITALGASSVVGIQAASIDMRNIADKTYKEHNLYDLQLKSTIGFDEEDISTLKNTAGVLKVMPTRILDVFIHIDNEKRAVRTYALPDIINTITILDGRLPAKPDECVIERRILNDANINIGDTISLSLDDMDGYHEIFPNDTFTVVGVVSSPLFISSQRGNTTLGDGSLSYYLYLHTDASILEVYTDVYLLMDGSHEMDNLTDDYYIAAESWKNIIEQIGDSRVVRHTEKLIDAQREINDGFIEYTDALNELEEKIANAKRELADVESELNKAIAELLDAEEKDAREELADAKKELIDAQEKLNDAPIPEWFYFTRKDGLAFDSYYQDTLRLKQIGYVFPLVFFLVAIMVSLTTMSRMVEESRTQIGIYKALGYRPFAIMAKYLFYAFSAAIIGSIFGVAVGSKLFPFIIADAYGHLYRMPPVEMPIPFGIAVFAVVSAVSSIILVSLWTFLSSMHGAPALLMRPKSPQEGKRVLLEKIPFIWKHLGFFSKVTARNIFRYKTRFIMSLAGVAGCSALLLTAFGLRDSLSGVADLQFGSIIRYDARAYLKELTTDEQRHELRALLPHKHLFVREESVTASGENGGLPTTLIIPDNPWEMNDYFHFIAKEGTITMNSQSVLVTEKLARVMGVSVGDSFSVTYSGGKSYQAKVTGIVDNYIRHFIYMAPDMYIEMLDEEPYPNNTFIFYDNGRDFAIPLLSNSNVRALIHNDELREQIGDQTAAMDIVSIVLIVIACSLALVVLFNLTNINISERIRELATIKVLGFNDHELAMYIYRENGVVTLLGILLGFLGGILLHGYVITTVEIDILKFPTIIHPQSYILAAVLSLAFALTVNIIMNYRLIRIDMVESLKNVE
ncbi:MAG: FtsX-like permease family protein [Lachnospiraceae bacterium]|nr:FtsX-like permease family protein [Lachnospiraceae bacterium]